jgi:hypothetical protein
MSKRAAKRTQNQDFSSAAAQTKKHAQESAPARAEGQPRLRRLHLEEGLNNERGYLDRGAFQPEVTAVTFWKQISIKEFFTSRG